MAVTHKTLTAHNLHNLFVEVESLYDQGWRLNKSVAVRRSLGNRYSVSLVKGEEDVVEKVEQVAQPESTQVEVAQEEVLKKPSRSKQKAKEKVEVEVEASKDSTETSSSTDSDSGSGE